MSKIVVDYGKPQSSRNGFFIFIVFLLVASIVIILNKDIILNEFGFSSNDVKNLENQIKELKKENQKLSNELKESFNESLETSSSFKANNDSIDLEEKIMKKDAEISELRNAIFLKNDEIKLLSNRIDDLNNQLRKRNENSSSDLNVGFLQKESNRLNNLSKENRKDLTRKPVLQKRIVPEYPTELIFNKYRRQIEATVRVAFDIDTEGIPINIKIESSSNRLFNSAALTAIKNTRFLPALNEYGNPIIYKDYSFVYEFK